MPAGIERVSDPIADPASVQRVLDGAIDLHYHAAPSPFPRRLGAMAAIRHYAQEGFGGVVMKSHHHSTVMELIALADALPDGLPCPAFGGIALNGAVGGLNPRAVELALAMGGRIVWFPTIAGRAHLEWERRAAHGFPASEVRLSSEAPVPVLERGRVRAEAEAIVELIAGADAILASGHIAGDEARALFALARERGVSRLLLNHPDFILELSEQEILELADLGAVVEHILIRYDERSAEAQPIERLVEWIGRVGAERTVLASDLGQRRNPLPADSFRHVVGRLLERGISESQLRLMLRTNPARLVGIEP
jgi:hypothetical protein